MRRIALINQKGGVGKTTTTANLGAALARAGQRVVVVDLDPQANLSLHLGVEIGSDEASTYGVLTGLSTFAAAIRPTATERLFLVPSHLDLSGAEMELAGAIGRETILRDALDDWEASGGADFDYLLIDCPPSLGLLSVNGLTAGKEAFITLQTEFFALQGMSKLVDIVQLLRRRLNPELKITGILPCLYDPRLRLAREVLGEIRRYFPGQVFKTAVRTNVKLAEAPSFGQTIFEYAPESNGARDYAGVAAEVLKQANSADLPGAEPLPEADPAKEAPAEAAQPDPVHESSSGMAPEASSPAEESSHEPEPVAAESASADPQATPETADHDSVEAVPETDPRPEPTAEPTVGAPEREAVIAREPQDDGSLPEFVLIPGRGLQPVRGGHRPSPAPLRAADLPPLPEEAFGSVEPDRS